MPSLATAIARFLLAVPEHTIPIVVVADNVSQQVLRMISFASYIPLYYRTCSSMSEFLRQLSAATFYRRHRSRCHYSPRHCYHLCCCKLLRLRLHDHPQASALFLMPWQFLHNLPTLNICIDALPDPPPTVARPQVFSVTSGLLTTPHKFLPDFSTLATFLRSWLTCICTLFVLVVS
jgi:hypothetical protein